MCNDFKDLWLQEKQAFDKQIVMYTNEWDGNW